MKPQINKGIPLGGTNLGHESPGNSYNGKSLKVFKILLKNLSVNLKFVEGGIITDSSGGHKFVPFPHGSDHSIVNPSGLTVLVGEKLFYFFIFAREH